MNAGTIAVLVVLVVIVFFAVRSSIKHMKGEGGCCGGGGGVTEEEKILDNPIIGKKVMHIEGMHCENCKNSIERVINKIDGASCQVNLKKKIAVVSYDREMNDDTLKRTVELLDFKVKSIETQTV